MGIHLKRGAFGFALVGLAAVHGSQAQTSTDTTPTSTDAAAFNPFSGTTTTSDTSSAPTVVAQDVRPPYTPPARTPYVPPPK